MFFKHALHKLQKYISYLKTGFKEYLKIIGAQNLLPITFYSDLMCNKTLKAKIRSPHTRIYNL